MSNLLHVILYLFSAPSRGINIDTPYIRDKQVRFLLLTDR